MSAVICHPEPPLSIACTCQHLQMPCVRLKCEQAEVLVLHVAGCLRLRLLKTQDANLHLRAVYAAANHSPDAAAHVCEHHA